jgi:hypothetical protein
VYLPQEGPNGRPLAGATGLRLLMASDPPRLLDVDRGTSQPVLWATRNAAPARSP